MAKLLNRKAIDELFYISIIIKGLGSLIEIIVGVILLFVPPSFISGLLLLATDGELQEQPTDLVANYIQNLAHSFSLHVAIFLAFYLLSRGIIKGSLIVALLYRKLWAYPLSLLVLGAFVVYQTYQIITTHSLLVVGLNVFDLIVMYFIWREYQALTATAKST